MKSNLFLPLTLLALLPLSAEVTAPKKSEEGKPAETQKADAKTTAIKRADMFEFTMPGEWKLMEGKKMELPNGKTIYPGGGQNAEGGISYIAFEDAKQKPADVPLKDLQWVVVQPLHDQMIKTGGKEESRSVTELNPDNKDQVHFVYQYTGPDGKPAVLNGIVLRGAKRCYVIQEIGSKPLEIETWKAIAKSFKES